ncbi:MAG: acetate--CoA ligase [Candidatus Thermoplasmatota archaeon]|nr:acetate--CoA ligase [Candidatus Thermoplasmatota archaeon]
MSDVVWKPTGEYIEGSNIKRFMDKHGIKDYDDLVSRSCSDISWFWDAVVKDLNIEWFEPYTKVVDQSEGIEWAKWFVGGKTNIAHNCLDRHAAAQKDKLALIWEGEDGQIRKMTYGEMYSHANRLANALKGAGIGKGDTVGIYMPFVPEILVVIYAAMKIGAICIPIFSGYGSSALASRLRHAESKVLFTADGSYRRGKHVHIKKEADGAAKQVPSLEKVIVLKRLGIDVDWNDDLDVYWDDFVKGQSDEYETEKLDAEDYSFIIYTSGTTGTPKGSVHTHAGCLAQMCKEIAYYFDLKDDDLFFWLTDIGWMMGPWMIVGVMNFGGTIFMFEGAPNYPEPDRLWDMIERHKVTTFGISPTAIRMFMRFGDEWVDKHDLSSLRILGSTGEPWDPDSWTWFFEKVGKRKLPIINISGGTEIVGCFLSPLPINELKPCTLRGPGLGMGTDVFDDDGKPVRGKMGHLVAKNPAPSMTKGFWNDPDRYVRTYWDMWDDIWYHGDWASIDEDGFWFLHGRSDDVIKVAGRRVGPSEIESTLMEHEAVSEAAAIGAPHEIKGEKVVTFVVLQPAYEPGDELREELRNHVAGILGKVLRPDELYFVKDLPKTRSAKIVRRIIRAKFLEEDLGDLSSIENPDAIDEISKII